MPEFFEKEKYLEIALALIILLSYGLVVPDLIYGWHLTYEDGVIENVGALAFLVSAIFFMRFFFLSRKVENQTQGSLRPNFIYLVLGVLFFFAFGEEISWGQRLLGWETPEHLKAINTQQETNLHNLEIFQHQSTVLKDKYGLFSAIFSISPGRLFFYFWFAFLVIIPLLDRYSPRWKQKIQSFHVPVAPLWAGGFMIATFILSKIFNRIVRHLYVDNYRTVDEFMEMNYAIVFAGLSLYWHWDKVYLERRSPD